MKSLVLGLFLIASSSAFANYQLICTDVNGEVKGVTLTEADIETETSRMQATLEMASEDGLYSIQAHAYVPLEGNQITKFNYVVISAENKETGTSMIAGEWIIGLRKEHVYEQKLSFTPMAADGEFGPGLFQVRCRLTVL
ncbi:MAG: hypothetical protein AAF202_01875 [Pseudomonadota bacterium]